MRKKLYAFFLFLLVLTTEIVFGKETNKSKQYKISKKHNNAKENSNIQRIRRSLDDEEDKPFWANRGKKKIESNLGNRYDTDVDEVTKVVKRNDYVDKEPFWGMRGRRESASTENNMDEEYSEYPNEPSNCEHCYGTVHYEASGNNFKDRRDENLEPFWGNRGRRSAFSTLEDSDDPFWGNRGRRQENEPFWGTRGRRKESPFLGARGRQEDEPFWGNRGRRQDSEPFWGNRGRRQELEPFWGNRGRREDEPFWGQRGRRKETEPFWGNRGRRKEDLKGSIMSAIDLVQNDIEHLSRLRRSDRSSFWSDRGRNSKLKHLFGSAARNRLTLQAINSGDSMNLKSDPSTVHDSRIYADEPNYIVVERSSRSSSEAEDPYFVSRGKKYYINYNLVKAARDRRGALEQIVKSVRNDPYYIARGKKKYVSEGKPPAINSTSEEVFMKAKELVCSAIDLMTDHSGKAKREIDTDRERRTVLKKLTAQLQIDPYYINRGKKSDENLSGANLREFITEIAEKCK